MKPAQGAELRAVAAHGQRVPVEAYGQPGGVQALQHCPLSMRHSTVQRHVGPAGVRCQNFQRSLLFVITKQSRNLPHHHPAG